MISSLKTRILCRYYKGLWTNLTIVVFQEGESLVLDDIEQSTEYGQKRGQRNDESRHRNDERELQGNHGRRTLHDYSKIRQLTARYLGYIPEHELLALTPAEWRDWLIGGQDRYLDQRQLLIEQAQANGLVQASKRLTSMIRDIEKQRYEIREPGSYARVQKARLEEEKEDVNSSKKAQENSLNRKEVSLWILILWQRLWPILEISKAT